MENNNNSHSVQIISTMFPNSSLIARADYDPLLESLKIYFKAGQVYEYCGVARTVLDEMKEASSAGTYFVQNIKGKYDFMKKTA